MSGATVGVALRGHPLVDVRERVATEGHPYSCSRVSKIQCGGFAGRGKDVTATPVLFGLKRTICRWHGRCEMPKRTFGKGKLIMKTVVSFLLGAVMLFGAATLGLQSGTANAKDKHDKDYWKHHHRHHRHHKHHYKNHLSY